MTYKDGITVRDQASWESMVFAYHIHEKSCNFVSGKVCSQCSKMSALREIIDNHKNNNEIV